jgi:SAM-dependent methyltransferase
MTAPEERLEFLSSLEASLADGSFVKLSLGNYKGCEKELKNIYARKILVKREEKLSLTYRYKTRDIIKNHGIADGVAKIRAAFDGGFQAGALFTTSFDLALEGRSLKRKPASHTEPVSLDHDRGKKRAVAAGKPWLHALGITDDAGNILKDAQDKYRQINKFVEIMSGLVKDLPPQDVKKIVDMGAGKGYLTFALYDYLQSQGLPAEITGVERRADLVELDNKIAREAQFGGLNFVQGAIEDYDSAGANILIALHACDTATDDAIYKGIQAGAALIVVAPCCHKQIRREMGKNKPRNELDFLTRHGIFLERHAEMVTDGLRGLILEYFGYKVKIFEFISDAHTPKNVLIVGVKSGKASADKEQILEKIREKKAFFGIGHHHLETLLGLASP